LRRICDILGRLYLQKAIKAKKVRGAILQRVRKKHEKEVPGPSSLCCNGMGKAPWQVPVSVSLIPYNQDLFIVGTVLCRKEKGAKTVL